MWTSSVYNKKPLTFKNKYMYPMEEYQNFWAFHNNFCLLVKMSMLNDIKMFKRKGFLNNACLVYSMWDGYKDKSGMREFLNEIKNLGIPIETLHTSGHADLESMRLMNTILKPKMVIPIHTTNKGKASDIFENAIILEDNIEFEI